jgi:hypothetical protein
MKISSRNTFHIIRVLSFGLTMFMFSGAWTRLDAQPIKTIAIGQNADGRIVIFTRGQCTGTVFTSSQVASSNGWGPWRSLPARDMAQCALGQNADGRLEAFILGGSGRCLHFWQEKANGDFKGGRDIGAVAWKQIAMGRNADGRLEVFALVGGDIFHFWQTTPNGQWSQSKPFGTVGVTQMAVASNADGRLEVFALIGGDIFHFWQTAPNGQWSHSKQLPDPELDFTPKIRSFTQTILGIQKSRLNWSVESGLCCKISIRGWFDDLEPTGSKEVWRPRNPSGRGTEYTLTVKCGKNEVSRAATVLAEPIKKAPAP